LARKGPKTGPESLFMSLMMEQADSLAVDGVCCELFSGPNSLLTGNNTGKFANLASQPNHRTTLCRGI
ncbi:MAG TPA: hypothetical protein VND90_08680, partial [Terracidiphilus sp.]|nr:hypothetical protein [Terracidiphilus sp.]